MVRYLPAVVWFALFLALGGEGATAAHAESMGCEKMLPGSEKETSVPRAITANDLVRLRDIGPTIGYPERESPFATSPDGRSAAFQVRRADPIANDYCLAMVVMPLRPGAQPKIVDTGGEMIRITASNRNLQNFSSGEPKTIAPQWSRDGQWIAYLRRDRGITQVWRARVDGSGAVPVTQSTDEVLKFAWSTNNNAIIFTTQPALAEKLAKIEQEGRRGFVYDAQFWPVASARPYPSGPIATATFAVELGNGQVRPATDAEHELFDSSSRPSLVSGAILVAVALNGERVAWSTPQHPELYISPGELHARIDGRETRCGSERCTGSIVKMWWISNNREVLFLRYEGAAGRSQLGLYRWNPAGSAAPKQILVTNDMLVGCELAQNELLCGRETATRPRWIVLVDPITGTQQDIYDPNPEFASLRLGTVSRLVWHNKYGAETFGDLVLPPNHRSDRRDPLIIVQYRSRGFLRGGMGDEYPIFAFAEHGFAVLSIDRPADYADQFPLPNIDAHTRANITDWADRKNIFASVESGIDLLDKMGLIDKARIGITGMSDGASTVQFALVNSNRFAAAAVSSCCEDPSPSFSSIGPAYRNDLLRWGYPRLRDDRSGFWQQFSLVLNAGKVRTPLLMQLPDDEFRFSLEAYEELKSRSKPVDLIVYPDEHHNKWQPAHREAVYNRSLDWFDFWLRSRIPASEPEKARWCGLAKDVGENGSICP